MDFDKAFKKLPSFITGFDQFHHKTAEDLGWLVLLQIDLYKEGEESDITNHRQLKQAEKYIDMVKVYYEGSYN